MSAGSAIYRRRSEDHPPHVDVILGEAREIQRRVHVWKRLVLLGLKGGKLARGLKSETAWGAFWWATRQPT